MITQRQEKILNTVVREYIDSAQPVSSKLLAKRYDFGISSPMIRIEMQKLTDEGYLLQPHTSAGRVPTDKGYRFFVNKLLEKGISKFGNIFKIEEKLKEEREDTLKLIHHLSEFLSDASSNLAAIHLLEKDFFFKEGWEEILNEPESEEEDFVSDFATFLENFEENVEELKINSGIKIYIGRENPFPGAKEFSIISSRCLLPDDEEAILSILGPKRMDYDRNISLMNSLKKILEKF